MKIGELARRSGLSAHTIRYYERIGLLPPPDRDSGGQRDYDASILEWISFLNRLRSTGMPIQGMLDYARRRQEGPASEPARLALLEHHRAAVSAHIAALQATLPLLDHKIAGYARSIAARSTDHDGTDA